MSAPWMKSTLLRFGVALGAGIAFGRMVLVALKVYFSPNFALLAGLAAMAVLVLGFYILLTANAQSSAEDR